MELTTFHGSKTVMSYGSDAIRILLCYTLEYYGKMFQPEWSLCYLTDGHNNNNNNFI